MKTLISIVAVGLFLTACATFSAKSSAEQVDSDSAAAYSFVASAVSVYDAKPGHDARGDNLRTDAWNDFVQEHQFYTSGNSAAALSIYDALTALKTQAQGL